MNTTTKIDSDKPKSKIKLVFFLLIIQALLPIIVVFLIFIFDIQKNVSPEESINNFEIYCDRIEEFIQSSKYASEDFNIEKDISDERIDYWIECKLSDNSSLRIYFRNENDAETFSVDYSVGNESAFDEMSNLNLDFICSLINIFSGYEFQKSEIEELIYQRNGPLAMELLNAETIRNGETYDFFGHFMSRYTRDVNLAAARDGIGYVEKLSITGLTKQGVKRQLGS